MIVIAPSILSADFSRLGEQIKLLDKSSAEFIHIDVMDGVFVPNISFAFPIMKSIRPLTNKVFDVHLMIQDPGKYIDEFVSVGADIITFHLEAENHVDRLVNYIKSKGIKVGVALNPATPVSLLEHLIPQIDMVLIMSVNPGFGGQKFIGYTLDKIKEVKSLANKLNKDLLIQVDGGIDASNIKVIVDNGANVIVAGSAVFKEDKIIENINKLREAL